MAINLIDILQNQLGDSFAKQASSFLGESEQNTQKAMSGILPALLGTVVNKGSNEQGASALLNLIKNSGLDGSMLNNISSLVGGGSSTNELMNRGGGILDMLMGDNKLSSVISAISGFSGVGKNSSKSLLSMAAPLLMSLIGKQVKSNNLGASGLMSLLQGQQGFIQKMLPAGLSSLAGTLGFADMGDNVRNAVNTTTSNVTETTKSGLGRFWPWLLLLGAVLLGLFLMRGCDNEVGNIANDISEGTENMVDKAKEGLEDAGEAISDASKAARDRLANFSFEENSFGARISDFLKGDRTGEGRFAFDNVTFETGSSVLTENSKEQLNQLVTMLEAYPKVNIGVEGFTDNTGDADANVTLSQERANMVKAYLIGQGIATDRVESTGYGAANPVASNDTEEGRAQNRRIEVVVK